MEAHLPHELDHFVVAHADAVHTRVHRQVVRSAHAVRVGGLGVLDGELGGIDARHDLVSQKQRDGRLGRLRKNEDEMCIRDRVEPFPFVPATWTNLRRSCGRPSRSSSSRMRSSPSRDSNQRGSLM